MAGERKDDCSPLSKLQQLPRELAVPLEFHVSMVAKQVFAPEPQEKCPAKVAEEDFAPAQGFAKLAKAAKLAGDSGNSAAKQELLALELELELDSAPELELELELELDSAPELELELELELDSAPELELELELELEPFQAAQPPPASSAKKLLLLCFSLLSPFPV